MAYRNTHESLRALHALAATQGGYFTAKQAAAAGYDYSHLVYHLKADNFERAGHGLYRLLTVPVSEHDDLIRLALWSRNRKDVAQAVVSHESALFLYQLSDVLPQRIHLTVPSTFRKRPPKGCVLHKAELEARDTEEREGFPVTTPLRTLIDVAANSAVSDEQLSRAVADALNRGLVRRSALEDAIAHMPGSSRIARVEALVR